MKLKSIAWLMSTPDAFRAWLLRQPYDATVGYACRLDVCPIATYLSVLTEQIWDVADKLALADASAECRTPDWALAFIDRVDAHDDDEAITAGLAVRLLDEALAETKAA